MEEAPEKQAAKRQRKNILGKLMGKHLLLFLLCSNAALLRAQELFPRNEPASTMPKGTLGVRLLDETFKEIHTVRSMTGLRLMYGITPKWTFFVQPSVSNHHDTLLPKDIITHTHVGNQTFYYTQSKQYGKKYPYLFNGFYFFSKYRFLSFDGEQKHLRFAVYGEYSAIHTAHDEAEPDLMDDNGGYGGGLIATLLRKKLAVSLYTGFQVANKYTELRIDPTTSPVYFHTELDYGRALHYHLSIGYLCFPKKYENYTDRNINLYLEIEGRSYESARLIQNGETIDIQSPALKGGTYVEFHPGLQEILDSNTRIELSAGFSVYHRSYTHFYPLYSIGIQRYFFRK